MKFCFVLFSFIEKKKCLYPYTYLSVCFSISIKLDRISSPYLGSLAVWGNVTVKKLKWSQIVERSAIG